MCIAAKEGHIEIVKQCKEWACRKYNEAMYYAVLGGHMEIVKLLKQSQQMNPLWAVVSYQIG